MRADLAKENPDVPDDHLAEVTVPVRPLATILADEGVGQVDVLVIDVEGHEPEVLAGTDLRAMAPTLAVVEQNTRATREAIFQPFREARVRECSMLAGDVYALGDDYLRARGCSRNSAERPEAGVSKADCRSASGPMTRPSGSGGDACRPAPAAGRRPREGKDPMLTFTCPCCGVAACRMGLAPGREAHPKRVGPRLGLGHGRGIRHDPFPRGKIHRRKRGGGGGGT